MKYKLIWLQVAILVIGVYCWCVPYRNYKLYIDKGSGLRGSIFYFYGIPTSLSPVPARNDQSLDRFVIGLFPPGAPSWLKTGDLTWKYPLTTTPYMYETVPG